MYTVASKCVSGDSYWRRGMYASKKGQIEIATALYTHPATTDIIMNKIAESKYPEVIEIANKWLERG